MSDLLLSKEEASLLEGCFSADTFTIEISASPARESLEAKGLIARHPGGPFGSRNSYYRTDEGWLVWKELKEIYP